MPGELPASARAVIVGGGIVGCSLAYHLTKLGWSDVVVLEQGRLSSGTTWHAAGIVGLLRSTASLTRLMQYSTELYAGLEAETGYGTGWRECGSLHVARTPDRFTQLVRSGAIAKAFGVECNVLSAREAAELFPLMRADDLVGALWLPKEGKANPTDLTQALARGAQSRGARLFEHTQVTGVEMRGRSVATVNTDAGPVSCEVFINCAGQWAKAVGRLTGTTVPLHSAEHFYVVTEPIPGINRDTPVLRDADGYIYFKEEVGGLLMGGFEPQAKPWRTPDSLPYPFEFQLLGEDWEHFQPLMDSAIHRVPAMETAGIKKFYNGPESFTPDTNYICGKAPDCDNVFVAAGFNSNGIASAGGVGMAMAEWIVVGESPVDLWPVDIRRFAKFNGNNFWLRDRVTEALGGHYAIAFPNREQTSARPLRRSPVYHLLDRAGAVFGNKMGWERANYFAAPGTPREIGYSFGRQNWFGAVAEEHRATREDVSVFDVTSFAKFIVKGPDACAALQWICTNDVDVAPGRLVYTGALNASGGYESDFTVTRLSAEEYLLVSGTGQATRDYDFLVRSVPAGMQAVIVDVSSALAVFAVQGPKSRELLTRVSDADFAPGSFAFADSRDVSIGYATARATRVTYVGELGWELYVPAEFAVAVYESLDGVAQEVGLRPAGYYAIESLRLEKGYRAWGRDLTPEYSPVEAGLTFACKLTSPLAFCGRDVVEKQKATGVRRRLVSLTLDKPEPVMWGGEPIMREGDLVGFTTSAAHGYTVGSAVALGYVTRDDGDPIDAGWLRDARYGVEVGGATFSVRVSTRPPYDPAGERVRS
jgi:heterotetrameric sarcosine oxidase gamma subunit